MIRFGPASRLVSATTVAITLALLSSPAAAEFSPPPPEPLRFGHESAAYPDGATALLFNPAWIGERYPSEFAFTMLDRRAGPDAYRGALTFRGLALAAAGAGRRALAPGLGFAAGDGSLRFGLMATSIPFAGGRVNDYRVGLLSRPRPWLALAGVADHVGEPRVSGVRWGRSYALAAGLRPLALSRPQAHAWGTRLTFTADFLLNEDEPRSRARFRLGGEFEPIPGVALRGLYFSQERGFQLGISLRGVGTGYHAQSGHDRDGDPRYRTHSLSFHSGEDRTVLVGRAERRVALVRVQGDLADEPLSGFTLFGQVATTPVGSIHRQLARALRDPLTRGVLLEVRGASGMAQLEELRTRIARLREAGKPVVAFLEYGGGRGDLYLASSCDRVVTTPDAFFTGLGLRTERRFYRKLLADWGIKIERSSYGRYKSAYRNYAVDSMPAPDREVIEHTLDLVQELFVQTVANDRHVDRERLLVILDGRRWPARELAKGGIVDSVGYREDALRVLGELCHLGKKPGTVQLERAPEARREWTVPKRVAVVYASGAIETGTSGSDLFLGPYMGSETMTRQIERAFRNPEVAAVVLRVESPGGSSLASDLIHHAVKRMMRETKKPLVVSMGRSAASGGYNISIPADKIYADRFTATGSIGVLYVKPSFEGWYARRGVRQEDFERGRHMRGWSMNRDWDAEIQAAADSATYHEYRDFVSAVAEGRGLPWDEVEQAAQGRVWFGEDALERRLVDELGGLEEAIAEARRRAGIPKGEKIHVLEYRRPGPGLIQRLLGSAVSEAWERSIRLPAPGEILYWADEIELGAAD